MITRTVRGRLIIRVGMSDTEGKSVGNRWATSSPVEFSFETQDWERSFSNLAFEVVGIEYEEPEARGGVK